MKKLLFIAVFIIFGFEGSYAQGEIRIGVNAGIPLGDADDISTLNFGADFAYLFWVADAFNVGPLVGYSYFLGEGDRVDFHWSQIRVETLQFDCRTLVVRKNLYIRVYEYKYKKRFTYC